MVKKNIAAYCGAGLIFVLAFAYAAVNFNVGAREYPMFISGMGILACGVLVVQTLLQHSKRKKDEQAIQAYDADERKNSWTKKDIQTFFLTTATILIYLFLIPRLGYITSTFLVMFSLLVILKREGYIRYLILTTIMCLMIYYVFGGMLNIFLPRGMFI